MVPFIPRRHPTARIRHHRLQPIADTFVTEDQEVLHLELHNEATHSTDTLTVTPEHPFYVQDIGFVSAIDLPEGTAILTAHGGWVRVGSKTWAQERETAYNFEVANTHTYFVGVDGEWVHNSNCGPTVVDTFDWVDPTNPAKGILAELDEYGTVKFMIEAGQGASKSGTDMLRMAMSKFGDRVTGIQAIWKYGDNLKAFNGAVDGGANLRDAAMTTWTARRAKSYGFAAPQVLKAATGPDGKFRDVSVLFLRGDL